MNNNNKEDFFIGATGAILNPPDNRDIHLASAQAPVALPEEYITDISMIPVPNQRDKGTCVGQAEGQAMEFFEYKETGKFTEMSKRLLYKLCKMIDGIPDMQGTYPRSAAKILQEFGIAEAKLVPNDDSLPYDQYLNIDVTDEIKQNAAQRKVRGYAFVRADLEEILQAIFQNKIVNATFQFGNWGSLPVTPNPDPAVGSHRVWLYGFKRMTNPAKNIPDAKIYFRNSWSPQWGEAGNGWFWFSDYKNFMFDLMAYADLPNSVIEDAKNTNFLFTRTLKYGMRGADVMELQKRLAREKAADGSPCFRYPSTTAPEFTTYFGRETEKAVQRYQIANNIVTSGTPETTGFGQLGPSTRAALNSIKKKDLKPIVAFKRDQLVKIMAAVGHPITVTDESRTFEEQDALYAIGRTKPGSIVTNAKAGESLHNFDVAFDVAFTTKTGITYDGPWQMLGTVGTILGLEWGGWPDKATMAANIEGDVESPVSWPGFIDKPHFQYLAGYTLENFQKGQIDESKFAV